VNNLGHTLVLFPKDAEELLEVLRVFRRHHKFVLARSAEVFAGGHPKGSMPVSPQFLNHIVGDGRRIAVLVGEDQVALALRRRRMAPPGGHLRITCDQ
jgi:hypothetical protein